MQFLTGLKLSWPRKNVNRAIIMKLVPPAKSVTLSNWKKAAIQKNMNCIETVTMAEIAR